MTRRTCALRWLLGILVLTAASGCGGSGQGSPARPSSSPSTGGESGPPTTDGSTPPQSPGRAVEEAAPYLLLQAEGWSLTGAATGSSFPGGLPFGGIWAASYESWPEPNRSISAGMMVTMPDRSAREIAADLGEGLSDVTINGTPGVAVEEHSVRDGQFIATHVIWDLGPYVALFTVYEVRETEAVALAQNLLLLTEAEWRTAADRANAEPPN